jgi:uncharacterized protein (TIRG00374 family)
MSKGSLPELPRQTKGRLLLLGFFLLLLYVVVPRLGNFSTSIDMLDDSNARYVGIAALLVIATYIFATAMYYLLAAKPLRFGRTFAIQVASAFANRLLPAGLGGLTLNVQYLRKSRHSLAQAIAVAGTTNLLGFVGHMLFLLLVVAAGAASFATVHVPYQSHLWLIGLGIAAFAALNLVLFQRFRKSVYRLVIEVLAFVTSYRKRSGEFATALLCSMALTGTYVAILYFCCMAIGFQLSFASTFVIFTLGMAASTITPTPGGLGGAEAGLFAGLVAYRLSAADALAIVLLFRLLTYWLPLLPGFVVFVAVRKRYL